MHPTWARLGRPPSASPGDLEDRAAATDGLAAPRRDLGEAAEAAGGRVVVALSLPTAQRLEIDSRWLIG